MKPCSKTDVVHKVTAANFHGILGGPFKVVPSHPDLFFFCPPGLDIGSLESGGRRRNETRSSEGASSKHLLSGSSARLKAGPEDEEDRTAVDGRRIPLPSGLPSTGPPYTGKLCSLGVPSAPLGETVSASGAS